MSIGLYNLLALEAFLDGYIEVYEKEMQNITHLFEGELLEPFQNTKTLEYEAVVLCITHNLDRVLKYYASSVYNFTSIQLQRLFKKSIEKSCIGMVKRLIFLGTEVTEKHVISALGNVDVLELLLDEVVKLNYSILEECVNKGRANSLCALLKRAPNDIDVSGLIAESVSNGDVACTVLLLEHSYTPSEDVMVMAVQNEDCDIVEVLLKHKFNVHAHDDQPIIDAAIVGNERMLELLLEHGANVNADSGAPLIYCAQQGYIECVELLLQHGANPKLQNNKALYKSIQRGHRDVVGVLLQHYTECPTCMK